MSVFKRPTVYVFGVLVVTCVALLGARPAESRSPTQKDLVVACLDRVNELEAEARALREELRLQRGSQSAPSSALAHSTTTMSADATRRSTIRTLTDACNPPFNFDRHGIKYYKPECLSPEHLPSCSIPYEYTPNGIKFYKPNCLEVAPSLASCDPPFEFDSKGVKSFKRHCL